MPRCGGRVSKLSAGCEMPSVDRAIFRPGAHPRLVRTECRPADFGSGIEFGKLDHHPASDRYRPAAHIRECQRLRPRQCSAPAQSACHPIASAAKHRHLHGRSKRPNRSHPPKESPRPASTQQRMQSRGCRHGRSPAADSPVSADHTLRQPAFRRRKDLRLGVSFQDPVTTPESCSQYQRGFRPLRQRPARNSRNKINITGNRRFMLNTCPSNQAITCAKLIRQFLNCYDDIDPARGQATAMRPGGVQIIAFSCSAYAQDVYDENSHSIRMRISQNEPDPIFSS